MHKIRLITKRPEHAWNVAPDVKIAFIISILQAAQPLFQNKDPQNPAGGDGTTNPEGESE